MNKSVCVLIIGLFLINSISALNCTYTEQEYYTEDEWIFYDNETRLDFDLVNVSNTKQGYDSPYFSHTDINAQFVVTNNHEFKFANFTVFFNKNGALDSQSLYLAPKGYETVTRSIYDLIDFNTIRFEFHDNFSVNLEKIQKSKEICKMCGDAQCFELGSKCLLDDECGSNVCSGMGICAINKDLRNDCNSTFSFCDKNRKCVTRASKSFGETASCEFECKSGFLENGKCKTCEGSECFKEGIACERNTQCGSGVCNPNGECGNFMGCKGNTSFCNVTNKCTLPSIKREGEAYSCEFECISQRGNGEVCIWSLEKEAFWLKTKNIFFGILIFSGILLVGYLIIWKRFYPLVKDWIEAKQKLDNLKEEIESRKKDLQGLNEEIGKSAVKIESLKEEIKQSQGIAKKKLEEELEIQLTKQAERISKIKRKDAELEKDEERLLDKEKVIQKRNEVADGEIIVTKKEIEAAMDKYGVLYGKKRIFYDEQSGYLKFVDGKRSLHRYIYKNKFGAKYDSEIHHIDNKKLNNDITNLIELSIEQHNRINHGKIIIGDWDSGILAIKTALKWQNSDFPKHIQDEINKRQGKYHAK